MEHEIQTQAEWLLDAIAAATQDRRFLRDDPQSDAVVCEAIIANARKAMGNLLNARAEAAEAEVERLRAHHEQLLADNAANAHPIRAIFRLDSGFASRENIAWLIEMGYDIYTKARTTQMPSLREVAARPECDWQRVGGNAHLTAWANTTVDGHFIYPVDVALARYTTGDTVRHAFLLHYGDDDVMQDLDGWFHTYNGRQTIEAGIKEGKNVFQMHHFKVRTSQALRLQEHCATFAANFVRFAALWLAEQQDASAPLATSSVKHMVQVCAHTSAWNQLMGDVWLLTFAEQDSKLGGHCVSALAPFNCRYRSFATYSFVTFEPFRALIAQKLR